MKYKHYAPEAEVMLFEGTPARIARAMKSMARSLKGQRRVGVLGQSKLARNFKGVEFISLGDSNPAVAAHRLFDAFRAMDRKGIEVVLCEGFAEGRMGTALITGSERRQRIRGDDQGQWRSNEDSTPEGPPSKISDCSEGGYSREQFTADLTAGLIVGIVALPPLHLRLPPA
jgi:hypothetical protein